MYTTHTLYVHFAHHVIFTDFIITYYDWNWKEPKTLPLLVNRSIQLILYYYLLFILLIKYLPREKFSTICENLPDVDAQRIHNNHFINTQNIVRLSCFLLILLQWPNLCTIYMERNHVTTLRMCPILSASKQQVFLVPESIYREYWSHVHIFDW